MFRSPYDGMRHFAAVEEGVLYRCGQPTPEQLDELISRLNLKTVISLRGRRRADDPDGWEEQEASVCRRRGVEFISIPFNHKNPPTREQVGQFLAVMRDAKRRPVLLHCRVGQQRTGVFCALFRVHIQNVSPEQALQEMDALGFDVRHRRHQRLLEAYRRFADDAQALQPSS